jgi:hypothetical protein
MSRVRIERSMQTEETMSLLNRHFLERIALIASLLLFVLLEAASGEPMMAPTLEAGVAQADVVALAEYVEWSSDKAVEYFEPPRAKYKVIQVLKGTLKAETVSVPYEFHDGSACEPDVSFKWDPRIMPAKGSRYFLLLNANPALPGGFMTYRGDFGRLVESPENQKKLTPFLNAKSESSHVKSR